MRRKALLVCLLIGQWFVAFSQSGDLHQNASNTNTWFMYFGDHKFSEKCGVHLEAQLRRSDIVGTPQQLVLRTGLN